MRLRSVIHVAPIVALAAAAFVLSVPARVGAQIPQVELFPDGPGACQFGAAVALSGDTAVVGAPSDSAGGAVYVYVNQAGAWSRQAKLAANDGGGQLGQCVAIEGDTIVAGARRLPPIYGAVSATSDGATTRGAAYVFTRSDGIWSQQAKLMADGTVASDEFASSVAITSDTVFVGAYGDSSAGAYAGAVYVFTRSGAIWSPQGRLAATGAQAQDEFSWSMAVSGDTLVVGAPGWSAEKVGSAHIFVGSGSVWTHQAKLTTAAPLSGDEGFGYSVGVSGNSVIVGADQFYAPASPPSSIAGAAFVFTRTGTDWSQQARLSAPDPGNLHHFGYSVAIHGDRTVVAEKWDDVGTVTGAGSAHLFSRAGGTWTEVAKFVAPDPAPYDRVGDSVAVSDDAAILGGSFNDAGVTYIFMRSGWTKPGGRGTAWVIY